MRISPVNVSIHTTNPELRVKMMKNKRAGEVLGYLRQLADAGISLCGQIVLCKGLNDGEELDRTMSDLSLLYPSMESVSIVPAGLTKFRDGLYELSPFSPEECADVIKQVCEFGEICLKKYGSRLFFPADELYVKAGLSLPTDEFYEGYSQIQNGVGMLTDMRTGFEIEMENAQSYADRALIPRRVSVATGHASYEHIRSICESLCERFEGLCVDVYPITNFFFGEQITVSGLLTGKDISEQLAGREREFFEEAYKFLVEKVGGEDVVLGCYAHF
jgi:putative radical SAM enzyme (TIGR03279 family)